MHPKQRREQILILLAKHGFIPTIELSSRLGVSEMTVRRDLRVLEHDGLVEKVTGGGQAVGSAAESPFSSKRLQQQAEKDVIARCAMQLIEPGMTVGLSAGTTTWMLAKQIQGFSALTFVTNSTNVAIDLNANGWKDIILTGGNFRTLSDALVGPLAEANAKALHTDVLFLGVHGIHPERGISTPNILEASINRVLMEHTDKVIVLFDHTKWGVQALAHIADLDEIDVAITDDGGGQRETEVLRQTGIDVLVAAVTWTR